MTHLEFKQIRKQLHMKQAEIAEAIGVGTRAVQYWEKGERKIPETTAYFVKNLLEEQERKTKSSASPVVFSELKVMYVPLANQYAQAGYLNGFADEEYMESLPVIPLPMTWNTVANICALK